LHELGLFCGTFNPIHIGHLLIAEAARDQFALDSVIFVTSPRPPHRSSDLLDGEARHMLVSAAVAENQHFSASRMEIDREGKSFTSQTVRQVAQEASEKYGSDKWRINLIVGADNVEYLPTWNDAQYLLETCRFLVAPRMLPTVDKTDKDDSDSETTDSVLATVSKVELPKILTSYADNFETIEFPYVAISSSAIRSRLRTGKSVLYMVPPAVNELLLTRNFYGPIRK
jgi:nicotinate-nucleotide adenylyltransferase